MRAGVCAGLLVGLLLVARGISRAGQNSARSTRSPHGNLAINCENCHTFIAWKPLRNIIEFDHNKTRYPLRGLHAAVPCMQCHVNLVFTNVGNKCADCHADMHRGQFGARCDDCHSVKGWRVSLKSVREHYNRFPLLGAHATLVCDDCHKGIGTSQFIALPTECVACHTQNFAQATLPNHVAAKFPTTCQVCHNMDSWFGVNFDHAKFTGFALTGMHATLECSACHGTNFQSAGDTCVSCHLKDYNGTNNPNHAQASLPQQCALCHNTSSWTQATFDHNTFTTFQLTGAHVTVACQLCHINGRFKGTPRNCGSCHLKDYQKTTDPNHAAAGFPTDCSICHTTVSWSGAQFDHSKTPFPLTGAHVTVACELCHINNNFTNLSTACVSCHLKDYNGTTNPNHLQAGFPQRCDVCHTTTAWMPANFDHSKTPFPLTGAHLTTPCNSCHVNGQFVGTPTDCYSCHKSQYQSTTDPNHVAAGFPTTCQTCHTTTSWQGATFNHTWWPTNHGGAGGVCSTCHTNPGNYAVFVCTNCHTKAQTDSHHSDVGGYVYNSINCYQCHKNGGGGGG